MILTTLLNGKVTQIKVSNVNFDKTCDVLIFGAGSAGVYLTDSASDLGANVILCEIGDNLGGMSVCGNVTPYYNGLKGGAFETDDAIINSDTIFASNTDHWEQRQIRFTERLDKQNVEILYKHSPTGLIFDKNRLVGARVFDGTTEIYIRAKITVDATSDGHLLRMTSVKKCYGRKSNGSFVPFTVRVQFYKNDKLYFSNADSGIMNHYLAEDFSNSTIKAHAKASEFLTRGDFINLALRTGIREGLTFEGEDQLKYEDILLNNHPQKTLFWAYSDLDRHGCERATEEELFQTFWMLSNLSTVTMTIPVPLGSVVPKGIKGLIAAGRCLSCDTYTQSAVRMNRDMYRMGECIGVASALAVKNNVDFLDIDYDQYLKIVKDRGCFDGHLKTGFYFDDLYWAYLRKMKSLSLSPDPKYADYLPNDHVIRPITFDVDSNFDLLKTDTPGVAFWSFYIAKNKKSVADRLYDALINEIEPLPRYNYAIALGILGDKRALDTLREIVINRDCFFYKDNRRTNQFRSAIAVCLLGRLGDENDLTLLSEILSDTEYDKDMYHTLSVDYLYHPEPDRNIVYFALITHTCMAIYKIYKRLGLQLKPLNMLFKGFFTKEKIDKIITPSDTVTPAYEELNTFIKYLLTITGD